MTMDVEVMLPTGARAIVAQQPTQLPTSPYAATIAGFGALITNPDVKPEDIEKRLVIFKEIVDLHKAWERSQRESAYHDAMALAKAEFKPVNRNKEVKFESKKEGSAKTNYWHEDLAEIARMCVPILSKYGLHYDFIVEQTYQQPISVQCVLHHRLGHEVIGKPITGAADVSGNKNPLQGIESTITYLKRSTVKAALGISVGDIDDDARAAGEMAPPEPVTAAQVEEIEKAIAALPNSHVTNDTNGLLKENEIEELSQLPGSKFGDIMRRIASVHTFRTKKLAEAAEAERAQQQQKRQASDTEAVRDAAHTAATKKQGGGLF